MTRKKNGGKSEAHSSQLWQPIAKISTQEKLSICCQWLINEWPEEHFLTILNIKSTNAEEIKCGLTTYIS